MTVEEDTTKNKATIPEKEWLTLEEIAKRWGCSVEDVVHFGETGKIEICFTTLHEGGTLDVWTGRRYAKAPIPTNILLRLPAESVGTIASAYRDSVIPIKGIRPQGDGKAETISDTVRFKSAPRKGLVVTRAERDRFEQEHGLGPYAAVGNAVRPLNIGDAPPKWPWGSHETDLIRVLAEAAKKYWSRYDPEDPTTAPTNEQVRVWLIEEKHVTKHIAGAIATILRADKLRPGPRKSV